MKRTKRGTKRERAMTRWLGGRVLWTPWFAQHIQGRRIARNIWAVCKARA